MSRHRYSRDKDIAKLVKRLVRAGCSVRVGPHLNIIAPCGARLTISSTSSDWRALLNARKDAERFAEEHGLAI